jgi:diacylglycerol kinase family enzyme
MLETMAMRPVIFKITTAGRTFKVQASGVFVANVEDLGLGKPCDLNTLTDGYLNLHILDPKDFRDYVAVGFRFAAGYQEGKAPHYVLRVKDVLIEVIPRKGLRSQFQSLINRIRMYIEGRPLTKPRSQYIPAMIDGEHCGTTPMRVTVIPHAVTVLVPAGRVQEQEELAEHTKDQAKDQAKCPAAVEGSIACKGADYDPGEITAFINAASQATDAKPAAPPAKT